MLPFREFPRSCSASSTRTPRYEFEEEKLGFVWLDQPWAAKNRVSAPAAAKTNGPTKTFKAMP